MAVFCTDYKTTVSIRMSASTEKNVLCCEKLITACLCQPPSSEMCRSVEKVSILSSFESRLMQLENSIIPVHKQTENLQRLQENVDKTLSCMDHVISYYHVAKDTDRIIREG